MTTTTSRMRELTVRGVILGGLITLVFTAANVYLGLKVGITFATAIPAAVISMAVLRHFSNHSIIENNIVQTVASAAGTLSSIIFVLPGLVMIGWWVGFPYWTTAAVCAVGGLLGVMYSIPLRRALVTGSDLPYPEGVAAAEVLKVGDATQGEQENKTGFRVILIGSVVAAVLSLLSSMKVLSTSLAAGFRVGTGGSLFSASLSLALIGVGHLVGLAVGIAMLIGLVISFGVLLPIRTAGTLPAGEPLLDSVTTIFTSEVRFIGAGAMAVAAIWTLIRITRPIAKGIGSSLASARARKQGTTLDVMERDIPINIVGIVVIASMIPIAYLLWDFVDDTALAGNAATVIVVSIIFTLVIGLVVAGVCGYMAGLIGSSNSPVSGVGILMVIIAALLLKAAHGRSDDAQTAALIAYTLFTAAIVFSIATIANDNLQDLKTGQLVGATPWKQQVALIIGVLFGAAVIPPVLSLMGTAFGFVGAPGAGENALPAPQAALISSLARGVFGDSLNWNLIAVGAVIGVVIIVIDEILTKTTKFRLPPLAVGMGMYLPMAVTLVIPLGALLGWLYDRWADRRKGEAERMKRLGVLLATGLIVGESLYGVVFAGIVGASGKDEPLALLGAGFENSANVIGIVVFLGIVAWLYSWIRKVAARAEDQTDPSDAEKPATR